MFQTRARAYRVSSEVSAPAPMSDVGQRGAGSLGARLEQAELADEAGERRDAAEVERGNEEQHRDDAAPPEQAAEPVDRRAAACALDEPGREEQGGLHDDVVHDVVDRRAVSPATVPSAMPKIM